jgi:hypothetical protein
MPTDSEIARFFFVIAKLNGLENGVNSMSAAGSYDHLSFSGTVTQIAEMSFQ